MTIETIYKDRNNPVSKVISRNGSPIDFSTVTRIILSFVGSNVIVDEATGDSSSEIDWQSNGSNGELFFRLKDVVIDAGTYPVWMTVVDPLHAEGQIIIDPSVHDEHFKFVDEHYDFV